MLLSCVVLRPFSIRQSESNFISLPSRFRYFNIPPMPFLLRPSFENIFLNYNAIMKLFLAGIAAWVAVAQIDDSPAWSRHALFNVFDVPQGWEVHEVKWYFSSNCWEADIFQEKTEEKRQEKIGEEAQRRYEKNQRRRVSILMEQEAKQVMFSELLRHVHDCRSFDIWILEL